MEDSGQAVCSDEVVRRMGEDRCCSDQARGRRGEVLVDGSAGLRMVVVDRFDAAGKEEEYVDSAVGTKAGNSGLEVSLLEDLVRRFRTVDRRTLVLRAHHYHHRQAMYDLSVLEMPVLHHHHRKSHCGRGHGARHDSTTPDFVRHCCRGRRHRHN